MTTLLWLRRDLRLSDHPALAAALADGGPVIPVFVLDPETEAMGAASQWRLARALEVFGETLDALGSRLVLRRGPARETLLALAEETGAGTLRWTRLYAPAWVARDKAVEAALTDAGLTAESHPGFLLHEPWSVKTGQDAPYKVYTPFWRALAQRPVAEAIAPPGKLPAPKAWPASDRLADWGLDAAMNRGAAVLARHAVVGEEAARDRLDAFLDRIAAYAEDRDRPDRPGTSGLSENLTWGEIAPAAVWRAGMRLREEVGKGAETFLKELAWREFAWSLLWHWPKMARENWRPEWDAFPWRGDGPEAERWRRGLTGEPMIDAGMREMFVTGRMHNRVRMLVASYLTKHLLTDWRVGLAWFEDCLIDWDPASNALGWQWTAGSGPDAAPYFRVFNPATQGERFDPEGAYRRRFVAGYDGSGEPEALEWFEAAPQSWGVSPDDPPPAPLVDLAEGRARALEAYAESRGGQADGAR